MNATLPFPPYLPDQTENSGTLLEAENVYALTDGFGPIRDFQEISDPLPASFKGGASFVANDGTSYLLVGTANGLVQYASGSWSDLIVGMSVTDPWRFAQFGNFAIGVNGQSTKVVDLVAGTGSTLTGAPNGKGIGIVGDYAVIVQDTGDQLSVFTSDINDHTKWIPDPGATQQPMLTGGEIMGFAGGEYGVILQRRRLVRMSRTGDATNPFAYDEITDNIGCASKASVAQYGRSVFFLSDQGFMAMEDGQAAIPIGSEQVDETFLKSVPPEEFENVSGAVDPKRKLVIWCVPGSPGRLWIYNYSLKRWSTASFDVEGIFAGFTSSETLEGLDAVYPDLDAMPHSLDDPRFAGGSPQFYTVRGGKVGSMSGENLKAILQLGFANLARDAVARLRSFRPITDCTDGVTIKVDVRDRLGDPANVKTAGSLRSSGIMPVRAAGRYAKMRMEIAAGSTWTYAQGIGIEFAAGGKR